MLLFYIVFFNFLVAFRGTLYGKNELLEHLGTKTPYRLVENVDDSRIIYPGCEPVKIWMIIRHGTRFPSKKFIREMQNRLPVLRDQIIMNVRPGIQLNEKEIENFREWNNNTVEEKEEKFLAHEGEDEMVNLAERMQSRFPNLLSDIYSNTSYKFRFTATQRTQQSAHYFARGLFGRATAQSVWYPEPMHRDPILRFYKLCEKWKKEIKKNPETLNERNLFVETSLVQETLRNISNRLGFSDPLMFTDVYTMYLTCAFETSWSKNEPSPWCAAFTNKTIPVLEYAEDLKYYWIDGYGHKLTYEQACPAIQNLVNFFQREEENPKAVLYFTHSGTILKLMAHLGLYKDKNALKHNNFEQQTDRLWRVSKIDAFASNLAAVLFRCENTKKILFLHQEMKVRVPCSSTSELCDFQEFLNTYSGSINNCSFNEMCSL